MVASESKITVEGVSISTVGMLTVVIGTPIFVWEISLSAFLVALGSQTELFPSLFDVGDPISLLLMGLRFLPFFGCSIHLLATLSCFT